MLRLLVLICISLTFPRSGGTAEPASAALQSKANVDREALRIGGVTLRLGLPKDAVLSDLGKYYFLQKYEPSPESFENWLILNKAKYEENHGALRFRSGKLSLASKEWTPEDKQYSRQCDALNSDELRYIPEQRAMIPTPLPETRGPSWHT